MEARMLLDAARHSKAKLQTSFKCDQCDLSFSRKAHLLRHSDIHSGIRPFKCSLCDSRFFRASDLKVHLRVHTGKRPYTCVMCERTFKTCSHLRSHEKAFHSQCKPTTPAVRSNSVVDIGAPALPVEEPKPSLSHGDPFGDMSVALSLDCDVELDLLLQEFARKESSLIVETDVQDPIFRRLHVQSMGDDLLPVDND